MSPLNPGLYNILLNNFGNVRIADEGLGMSCDYFTDHTGRRRMQIRSPGEYYCIRCLFCPDGRQHLWINHRWGVYDPETKSYNWWLAHCFRENCLSDGDNLQRLRELTTCYLRRSRARQVQVAPGYCPPPGESIELPHGFVLLNKLKAGHPARKYVRSRGFDPDELSRVWGVGFAEEICCEPRLIIPIYNGPPEDAKYFGWQGRAITSDAAIKYYTAHGLKKSHTVYGIQRVNDTGPIIVCEGPTDVWRIGQNALALMGKKASDVQVRLINQAFFGRTIVIMLDPDAAADARALQERLESVRRLSLTNVKPGRVVVAQLPDGRDPGDCTRDELEASVQRAKRQSVSGRRRKSL